MRYGTWSHTHKHFKYRFQPKATGIRTNARTPGVMCSSVRTVRTIRSPASGNAQQNRTEGRRDTYPKIGDKLTQSSLRPTRNAVFSFTGSCLHLLCPCLASNALGREGAFTFPAFDTISIYELMVCRAARAVWERNKCVPRDPNPVRSSVILWVTL